MALTQVDQGLLSSTAQYTGFKNRIINGAMAIDQRKAGASLTLTTNFTYALDRWFMSCYGSTSFNNATIQQLSSGVVSGFSNYLRIQANSTTSTNLYLSQSIETKNCVDLAGQKVTISFWYRVPVNSTNTWSVSLGSSTSVDTKVPDADPTPGNLNTFAALPNTSTWTFWQGTVTVPSDAKTISVVFINGYNNVVNGAQFDITGVQLEKGTQATSFDYRPYGTELALCQRYYEYGYSFGPSSVSGIAPTATLQYLVEKRATPSISVTANTSVSGSAAGTTYYSTAGQAYSPDTRKFVLYGAVGGSIGATWTSSAEL